MTSSECVIVIVIVHNRAKPTSANIRQGVMFRFVCAVCHFFNGHIVQQTISRAGCVKVFVARIVCDLDMGGLDILCAVVVVVHSVSCHLRRQPPWLAEQISHVKIRITRVKTFSVCVQTLFFKNHPSSATFCVSVNLKQFL